MIPKPFSLHAVLKIRKRKEDLAQQKFMRALKEYQDIEKKLVQARRQLEATIAVLEQKQQEGMLAVELERFEEAIHYKNHKIRSIEQLLQEKQQICENKRRHLLAKSREHKVLQALQEKQDLTWRRYIDKKEANMLDEIAILHHGRSQE